MIGIDIIEIDRIEESIKNEKFLKNVFTTKELEYYKNTNNSIQTLAGFFAAKEAVSKAFNTGFNNFKFSDVEVLHFENGAPYVKLYGNALSLLKNKNIYISISHCKTFAIAMALLSDTFFYENLNSNLSKNLNEEKFSNLVQKENSLEYINQSGLDIIDDIMKYSSKYSEISKQKEKEKETQSNKDEKIYEFERNTVENINKKSKYNKLKKE